jgi:hypothetical protein
MSHDKYNKYSYSRRYYRGYYLDRELANKFSRFCRILGYKISDALEQAMRDFIKSREKEAESRGVTINIYQPEGPLSINLELVKKIELRYIKKELTTKMELVSHNPSFISDLRGLIPKAIKVYKETGDPELEKLLEKVDQLLST